MSHWIACDTLEDVIRTDLRAGDLGEIVRLHGVLYAVEHGLDATFEAGVAAGLAAAVERGWPAGAGEGVWIAERDGRLAGAVGLTDEGEGCGRVRWFLLDPASRGAGLGRRLLSALLETAREHGHERLELVTFSDLATAAHLYRSAGFERVSGQLRHLWGRELVFERYELALAVGGAAPRSGAPPARSIP